MKKVLVTGGESMVGGAIVGELLLNNVEVDVVPHSECDILNYQDIANRIKYFKPESIIHAAGWNGGIGWNKDYPATIYYRTAIMALNVYNAALQCNSIKKIVGILASCSYPDISTENFVENQLWDGKPNASVECHGLAKRIIADYGRQISKQYPHIQCISCILNNCYGPYDSFHPEKTKVVGALIRRFVEAKQNNTPEVVCWGTGAPLREFVFAPDAGSAIVQCMLSYSDPNLPVNISSGCEISIKELTETIIDIVEYNGKVVWDTTKSDGQMRKKLNTDLFQTITNMKFTNIRDGLKHTIEWYINNKDIADSKGF
jgi:GDP-L-fucose synthase